MKKKTLQGNGKVKTNKLNSKISWGKLSKEIKEAQKDPQFMAEIRRFIKITTS